MMISQIVSNLPFFAIYLAALILALARWDKHPTASVLVVTAAGIAVLSRVAGLALPMVLSRSNLDTGSMMWVVYGLNSLIAAVGLACLVAAVFADRSTKSGPPPQFR